MVIRATEINEKKINKSAPMIQTIESLRRCFFSTLNIFVVLYPSSNGLKGLSLFFTHFTLHFPT